MTPGTEQLSVSRTVRASPERVFDAWTDPAQIVVWWGAGGVTCPEAEIDLRVGGSYRLANRAPTGETAWITGTFSRIDPPHGLDYTWAMEPISDETHFSLVEVRFVPVPEGTEVTVSQTRIVDAPARDIHLQGWIGCLDGLAELMAGGR